VKSGIGETEFRQQLRYQTELGNEENEIMEDNTQGYSSGDKCPECGGLVTIRRGEIYEDGEKNYFEYAQCANCSWSTSPLR
jgi:ssDNA-binding Zn-finger/Zn-ribbon topoisomerase 1